MPILIAPTAMQRMAHPDGELATVRAAAKAKTAVGLSSWSTTAVEDAGKAHDEAGATTPRWFQLYIYKARCRWIGV